MNIDNSNFILKPKNDYVFKKIFVYGIPNDDLAIGGINISNG